MIYFLFVIIMILCGIICFQWKANKKRNRTIKYIDLKLNNIIMKNSSEKLLVFTDDQELIPLLVNINNLLDYNQKTLADYSKKEESIRKMLSNISHDLKTPLTVIVGYLESIKLDWSIEDEIKEEISKVYDKSIELLELINKFFDLAKLESGDTKIQLKMINISEICRKNILAFYDILSKRGVNISVDIPEENVYIMGNEEALDRILENLLSNAIRYGSDGNVLGLNLRVDDQYVYVDVWDKGKGIEEWNKEKIFERLYTLEDSRNKLYQGSGLGLTITKRLVENLDGDITLYSKPFEKTIFTVRLRKVA